MPVAFFGIMCIPKHYIKPQPRPREIISRAYDLDMGLTSNPGSAEYFGGHLLEFKCLCMMHMGKTAPGTVSPIIMRSRSHGHARIADTAGDWLE